MRTEYELIKSVILDTSIEEQFKRDEYRKLAICEDCPKKSKCFNCGAHRWWLKPRAI